MKNLPPKLFLSEQILFPFGWRVLRVERKLLEYFFLCGFLILAGVGAGFLLVCQELGFKLTGIFLGIIVLSLGVVILNRLRSEEFSQLIHCLKILSKNSEENWVYYDCSEGVLGKAGFYLNKLLENSRGRLERQLRLIGGISHDLRTPLTILKGNLEVALMRSRTPEEYQEIFRSNLEEIDRISRLVEDLLTLSRAEAGELKMEFSSLNLKELLVKLIDEFSHRAKEKELDLTIQAEMDIIITADKNRLMQLFANLIENAIQYSPRGKRIEVKLGGDEKEAWVEVIDQGIGISSKDLPYIFEPFFRSPEAREMSQKSYGLGLSICKKIALAHNGDIEVKSRVGPDSGTTIRVRLPRLAVSR